MAAWSQRTGNRRSLWATPDGGVVEELFNRFFLVTLLAWLGSLLSRIQNGRPTRKVYWAAILLVGLFFGWAHVGARLGIPGAPVGALAAIMILSTLSGVAFGWLYWKLEIEWAIFAHFAYDGVVSAVLLKVYLLRSAVLWVGFVAIAILAGASAWRALRSSRPDPRTQ